MLSKKKKTILIFMIDVGNLLECIPRLRTIWDFDALICNFKH